MLLNPNNIDIHHMNIYTGMIFSWEVDSGMD